MNLDENENEKITPKSKPEKLSRKEKKALKKARKEKAKEQKRQSKGPEPAPKPEPTPAEASPKTTGTAISDADAPEEATAHLEPAPIPSIPPPRYTLWEKISPPARRKRQMANMESGFREVLGLVQSMRENQEVLLESFKKLPEAVDSVKKLADHSARQSELLEAMNLQAEDGPMSGKFNETLVSMDKTTQLLLERAQRSEERLYGMLQRAQRRIAFMTLLVLLLFLGAVAGSLFYIYPKETRSWLDGTGFKVPEEIAEPQADPTAIPTVEPEPTVLPSTPAPAPVAEPESDREGVDPERKAELQALLAPQLEELNTAISLPAPTAEDPADTENPTL